MLMITENTIIKLYKEYVWEEIEQDDVCTKIIDHIIAKLSKTDKPHPLKELFLDEDNRGPYYSLIHFVFQTVEEHVKKDTITRGKEK